jgi:capsular exopolysaccharide synthesis family protein
LLVDADLRKPKAAENLGMDQNGAPEGLSQILQGRAELEHVLLRSETLDFLFLPAGPVPSHPSELLASNNLERVIQRMAAMSDWVVIDAPPILSLADATRLAPLCDAVLLVVQANATPAKIVNRAIQQIGRERVAGIVLNRVKQHHSSAYYYKSYSKQGRGK